MAKSILAALSIFLLFSYTECPKQKVDTTETAEYIWNYAQNHPRGFTINIITKEPATSGIVVSYYATQNSTGKESLKRVIEHALNHNNIVGGWLNPKDSLYYFDSNKIFSDGKLKKAIDFAIRNKQSTIYDLSNNREIEINYSPSKAEPGSKNKSSLSMTN